MEILVRASPWSKHIKVTKIWYDELTGLDIYKVNLTAKAVNNSANKQLLKVLADYFKVKIRDIDIHKWQTSKIKKLTINI